MKKVNKNSYCAKNIVLNKLTAISFASFFGVSSFVFGMKNEKIEQNEQEKIEINNDSTSENEKILKLLKKISYCEQSRFFGKKKYEKVKSVELDETVTDEDLKLLSIFPKLNQVDLLNCKNITNLGIENLSKFKNIIILRLGDNDKIDDKGLSFLANMTNLGFLVLENLSLITNEGLMSLGSLPKLDSMRISFCNKTTDLGIQDFLDSALNLTKIIRQDEKSKIEMTKNDIEMEDVKQSQNSQTSSYQPITDAGSAHLKDLPNLQTLNFNNCSQIKDEQLDYLKSLVNL